MTSTRRHTERPPVCIVGAGLAGSLLAYKLSRRGVSCVVVDAGPRYTSLEKQRLRRLVMNGAWPWDLPKHHPAIVPFLDESSPPYPLSGSAVKAVGGSTLAWLGTSLRLHPDDLRMYSQHSVAMDWPIRYEALEPLYDEAEQELGVSGEDDNPWLPRRGAAYPLPGLTFSEADLHFQEACARLGIPTHRTPQARSPVSFGDRPACRDSAWCIPLCPTGAKYSADLHLRRAEATGLISVRENTHVVRLELRGGRAQSAHLLTPEGMSQLDADIFIICAHTIETTRILLTSQKGWGQLSPALGRHLMDHPLVTVDGILEAEYAPRGYQTLQSYAFYPGPERSKRAAFKLEFSTAPQFAWDARPPGSTRSRLKITAMIDMLPREDNAIWITRKSGHDLTQPAIRLRLSSYETDAADEAVRVSREILRAAGATSISATSPFWGAAHPSGTCRMGLDPTSSVVGTDCKLHWLENVYVVGSSLFPTIGAANPSLTIAALALGLGDRLPA